MKRLAAGAAGIPLALLTVLGACLAGVASSSSPSGGAEPSPAAVADIPAAYLALYRQAATTCPGMAWTLLAAVGKVETNHGRSPLPGVHSGENSAGAGGPMQFLAATWAAYGRDGNSDGRIDRYHPADAIAGAAHYLCANGGGSGEAGRRRALWAYNHSSAYQADVEAWIVRYTGAPTSEPTHAATTPDGRPLLLATVAGITVDARIAGVLGAMIRDAADQGVPLTGGGYRDPSRQIALRRAHCGTSHYAVYEMPASACRPPTARPGQSMHEQGLAVDFENCSSRTTACYRWLAVNAARYGFMNLPSEPWHWSTSGR